MPREVGFHQRVMAPRRQWPGMGTIREMDHTRSAQNKPMYMGYTTCWVICGNGRRIGTMIITIEPVPIKIRRAQVTVNLDFCGEVAGCMNRYISARPIDSGVP